MAENKGKFYMTTAIAYTSGKPHIGNTYEIILAMQLRVIREPKAMMSIFRPELMNTDKRFRKKQRQQIFHRKNL